jgi:hypothetical protein
MEHTNQNFVGLWVRMDGRKGFDMKFDVRSTKLVTALAHEISKRENVLVVSTFRKSGKKHNFKVN